jgi:hypothetical protein
LRRFFTRVMIAGCSLAGLSLPAVQASAAVPALRSDELVYGAYSGYKMVTPADATLESAFKVPTLVACTKGSDRLGAGEMFFEGDKATTGAMVTYGCDKDQAYYLPTIVDNNNYGSVGFTPMPGDVIVISVSESATSSSVTMTDDTQNMSATISGDGDTNYKTIVGNISIGSGPIPRFVTEHFNFVTLNGASIAANQGVAYNMKRNSVVEIEAGKLTNSGEAFTEKWVNS